MTEDLARGVATSSDSAAPGPRVFLSYRRIDAAGHAGRLLDALAAELGEDQVFMDVVAIAPGIDFVAAIEEAVSSCAVLVAVIGRGWLDACDENGRRRLDDPHDFVRLELVTALSGSVRVVPVLLQGAQMPKAEELPDELAALSRLQAIELSDSRWRYDLDRLLRALEGRGSKVPPRTNLPRPATSFLGRKEELAELLGLLNFQGARLVTLTGPGGSGKTRLAVEAASRLVSSYVDGVWWVPLAALRDSQLVLDSVARVLGTKEELAQHIAEKRMLLLLDNFEQVVAAAPQLAELLSACPNLSTLVTSREALHVAAEREFVVAPLREQEAVALLLTRARAVVPDFSDNDAVREICRRLDCLPLAVELAAARVKVLSPDAMLGRLEERLPLLTGGPRDAPERQRTLRETIAWSYELLSTEEQRLFCRLSVVTGGCTLEMAEAVCGAELDILASLVDKSLLRSTDDRFWMLQTIREYATERLDDSCEAEDLRRKHAEYFLELTEEADSHLEGADQGRWLALVEADHDNIRAALGWASDGNDSMLALRLASACGRFWMIRAHLAEGQGWIRRILLEADDAPPELRAKALLRAGGLAESRGDYDAARRLYQESLTLRQEQGDRLGAARVLTNLGNCAFAAGDLESAESLYRQRRQVAIDLGDELGAAHVSGNLGVLALVRGNAREAASFYEESASIAKRIGNDLLYAIAVGNLADALVDLGDSERAAELVAESLRIKIELGERVGAISCLESLARAEVALGRPEHAARLLGCAAAQRSDLEAPLRPHEAELVEEIMRSLRERLSEDVVNTAWSEGSVLSLEQVVDQVLAPPKDKSIV